MKKLNKKTIIITVIIILIIGIYYFFIKKNDYDENSQIENFSITNEENEITEDKISDTNDKQKIIVYVAGAVKNEGIYELDENSRIADGIEKAGGLTDEANIKDINLAYVLEDGMKVYIPKNSDKNDVEDETSIYVSKENGSSNKSDGGSKNTSSSKSTNDSQSTKSKSSKININTATQSELETLPGIGPSTATKIINYRKENGKFNSIEDIKKVKGIGDSKFSQIKDLITN